MGKRSEKELDLEMRFHLEVATQGYLSKGLSPDEARRLALMDFGGLELAKEEARDLNRFRRIEQVSRDLQYAARQLCHAPAFTLAVLLTLAVAIAANTAMFSVVRAVLLQPLPYQNPSGLVSVWQGDGESYSWYTFSYPRFRYFRQNLREQADLAAYDDEVVTASMQGEPMRLEGGRVSANFFPLLGVKPVIGRFFRPAEDRHGADPVFVLSYRFWKKQYSSDPGIVGRAIRIDNEEFTIIGVLPSSFQFLGAPIDVWRSRIVDTRTFAPTSVQLGVRYLTVLARLSPGVSLTQFRAKLVVTGDQYSKDNPSNSDIGGLVSTAPLQQKIFGAVHLTLIVLWGAVVCLLTIACANVANLILARATGIAREISLRIALGASWMRVAQQLLTETAFLATCSVVFSVPLALLGMRALIIAFRQLSPAMPDVHPDLGLLVFTLAVTAAVGVVMGTIPMGLLLQGNAQNGIRAQERSCTSSKWMVRLRNGIVALQIRLSVMLLAATGLLAKSLIQLRTLNSGLRTEQVAVFPLDLMPH